MTENQTQKNTVSTTSIGIEPWAASFSIDNTTIENYVINLFTQQTKETIIPVGAVLTDEQPGVTKGNDLQNSLSLTVFFDYEDFAGNKGNAMIQGLNPIIAAQLPLNTNVQPVEALIPILSRVGKVIDRKPVKYVVTPKQNGRAPMVKVTLDLHAILRLILQASPNSFVVAIMASKSNRTGDQIVIDVTKAIANDNNNNGGQANSDLRDMARNTSRGGQGFNGGQSRNNQRNHSGRGW